MPDLGRCRPKDGDKRGGLLWIWRCFAAVLGCRGFRRKGAGTGVEGMEWVEDGSTVRCGVAGAWAFRYRAANGPVLHKSSVEPELFYVSRPPKPKQPWTLKP